MKYACMAFLVAAAGCTSPNPASCLEDNFCSDPARPYCDDTGSVGGIAGACLAVDCTPGTFLECSGSRAKTCNADGNNYEPVECPFGCGDAGCIPASCPVGATAICAGTSLVSCDGQGHATNSQTCTLGCNDTAKRCNKLNPSNGLAGSLDDAAGASDLNLSGAATIDTDLGTVTDASGARTVSSAVLTAGLPVGVFVIKAKSFKTGGNVTVVGTRALAIVSDGTVRIDHVLSVAARKQLSGPGAITNDLACRGTTGLGNANGHAGGGGGGFGTAGGRGGNGGSPTLQGANPGAVSGNSELVPLRGGCPGGRDTTSGTDYTGGGGGGAIQIVSGTGIELGDGGFVNAGGAGGGRYIPPPFLTACQVGVPCDHGDAGGSGGGILLEAPLVTVASLGGIVANGGGGACDPDALAASGGLSDVPAAGVVCAQDGSKGGDGAAGTVPAQSGGNGTGTTPVGGGGGGGAGRVRINVVTPFAPAGVVSGAKTLGALATR